MKKYNNVTIKPLIEDIISCHNCYCSFEIFQCPMLENQKIVDLMFFRDVVWRPWNQSQLDPGTPEIISDKFDPILTVCVFLIFKTALLWPNCENSLHWPNYETDHITLTSFWKQFVSLILSWKQFALVWPNFENRSDLFELIFKQCALV